MASPRFPSMIPLTLLMILSTFAIATAHGWVTLINSTPYSWRLTYKHSYQMLAWQPPDLVEAGESREFYYRFSSKRNKDDAAEAAYTILGNFTFSTSIKESAAFTVQARSREHKRVEVLFRDGLSTLNNPANTLLDLDREEAGTAPFVLSGDGIERPFWSNNPPIAWMQSILPTIGSKPLDQISLLASHDAGASELTRRYLGTTHNVITQSQHIYQQLVSGARYFDIRPVLRRGKWSTAHLTVVNRYIALGGFTRTLRDVINDINLFNDYYPGELIILDLKHAMNRRNWAPLDHDQWFDLYDELSAIKDLWILPKNLTADVTTLQLSQFIQPASRSAVVVRTPAHAPSPARRAAVMLNTTVQTVTSIIRNERGNSSSATASMAPPSCIRPIRCLFPTPVARKTVHAFEDLPIFRATRFPTRGKWSRTASSAFLAKDQLQQLHLHRLNHTHALLRSKWELTQNWQRILNIGEPRDSILALSSHAKRELYKTLWRGVKEERVIPNMVEVDNISGRGIVAFVMALNDMWSVGPSRESKTNGRQQRRHSSWSG